ncbi:MAG: site-specific integrase [Vicinamibacterales bacterium]
MPERRKPLTQSSLFKIPVRPKRYSVPEGTLPGLAVRVDPTGQRAFQLLYRVALVNGNLDHRQRIATLGRVDHMTLAQARQIARSMLGDAARGTDPLKVKDAARKGLTVRTAFEKWLGEHVAARRAPSTVRNYRLAARHINQLLGGLSVDQLTTADAVRLHRKLADTPYLANRVLAALSSFISWCERQGIRAPGANPCRGVEKFSERGHDRYLSDEEYGRLGAAIEQAKRAGSLAIDALTAIEVLLMTGCRPAEVLNLEWAHVDLAAAMFRLPKSKTGEKVVYLSPEVVDLLRRWPKHVGTPWVFPGTGRGARRGTHLVNLSKPWLKLRRIAQLPDVRLYDACRHSFATVGVSEHGHTLPVLGALLGHKNAATTNRYAHIANRTARAAGAALGNSIASKLKGRAS